MMQPDDSGLFGRLSFRDTFGRTISIYRSGFSLFFKIAVAVLVPATVFQLLVMNLFFSSRFTESDDTNDPTWVSTHVGLIFTMFAVLILCNLPFQAIGEGALVRAVAEYYSRGGSHADTNWQVCLQIGLKRLVPLLIANVVSIFCTIVGLLVMVVPGIYMLVSWFVYSPAIVIERTKGMEGLSRSWTLTSKSRCYILWVTTMVMLVTVGFSSMVNAVLFRGASDLKTLYMTPYGAAAMLLPSIFSFPIFAICKTVIYIRQRACLEGIDQAALQNQISGGAWEGSMPNIRITTDETAPAYHEVPKEEEVAV